MKRDVPGEELDARANRLREALRKGGGAAAVGRKLNIAVATLNNYLAGRDMPVSVFVRVVDGCGVSIGWLAAGFPGEGAATTLNSEIRVRPSILAAISESYELINDKYNVEVGIDWLHETLTRTETYVRHREARDAEEKK